MIDRQSEARDFEHDTVPQPLLDALHHDIANDPEFKTRSLHAAVESQTALMHQLVIEAYLQSDGDIKRQESFVAGGNFVLAAFRRLQGTKVLEILFATDASTDTFEEPDEPVETVNPPLQT